MSEQKIFAQVNQLKQDNKKIQKSKYFSKYSSNLQTDYSHIKSSFIFEELLLQKLSKNKIVYNPNKFASNISIINLSNKENNIITTLMVSLSYFTFQIIVVNMRGHSIFCQGLPKISEGVAGGIFSFKFQGLDIVIKNIQFYQNKKQKGSEAKILYKGLSDIVKEYCFTKLFSVLEIGPKVSEDVPFDLIIFQDSAQFFLERCLQVKCIQEQDQQCLKNHLNILHKLKIVHGDIKCENVMWSQEFKKIVFIDFGFSLALDQSLGQMTLTHYFGTYQYCLTQMKNLLTVNSIGYVDLYYNDMVCLQNTIKRFYTDIQPIIPLYLQIQEVLHKTALNFWNNIKLMHLAFQGNFTEITNFLKKIKKFQFLSETIQILTELSIDNIPKSLLQVLSQFGISSNNQRFLLSKIERNNQYHQSSFDRKISSNISFTWLVLPLLIFSNEDITPLARQRKSDLNQQLTIFTQINFRYCELLVQYISNLYTTEKDAINILEKTISKLKQNKKSFDGINLQKRGQRYLLYQLAFKVCLETFMQYSIDLTQIFEKQAKSKKIQTKSKISQADCKNLVISFQNDLKLQQKIQFNEFIINKQLIDKQASSQNNYINQINQIKLKKNYQQMANVLDQNSFLFHCKKFYPASKCSLAIQKAKINQFLASVQLQLQTYHIYQQQTAKVSINRCFDLQTLFYFSLVNKIQLYLHQPSEYMGEDFAEIRLFLTEFNRTYKIIDVFTLWFQKRLSRIKQYTIGKNLSLLEQWVYKTKQIYEQLLYLSICKRQILIPSKIFVIVKLYSNLLRYIKKKQLRLFRYFTSQDVWVNSKISQCRNQEKIFYFQCKMVFPELLKPSQAVKILSNIQIFIEKNINQSIQQSLFLHVLCFQFSFLTSKFIQCEQELLKIIELVRKQPNLYLWLVMNLSLDSCIQNYFTKQPLKHFRRSFAILIDSLKMLRQIQTQQEKQLMETIFIRKIVKHYLQTDILALSIKLFVDQYQNFRQLQKPKNNKELSNLIVVFQMFLTSICKHNLFEQIRNDIPIMMKIIHQLIPFSSFYIKKRFNSKYFSFLLQLIHHGFINNKNSRKIHFYKMKQYRNCQYAIDQIKLRNLSNLSKNSFFKEDMRIFKNLRQKLASWNRNKQNDLILGSVNINSSYFHDFQSLLSQTLFADQRHKQKKQLGNRSGALISISL